MKAYFCNKPRQKLSIPKNDFVNDEIKRLNQQRSRNEHKNHSPKQVLRANKSSSDSNKLRKREADDKYFLPKEEVDLKAKKGDKLSSINLDPLPHVQPIFILDFSRNIENLNKIFSKTNINEKWDNSGGYLNFNDDLNS